MPQYRVRFIDYFGLHHPGYKIKTLTRGEILYAFLSLGYPERSIPPDKVFDQCKFEETVFELSILPDENGHRHHKYDMPAGIVSKIAEISLERSGFTENSDTQLRIVSDAISYCDSPEGKQEALVSHTFPGVPQSVQLSMGYEEWARTVFQAIVIQQQLYGVDCEGFLTGTGEPNIKQNVKKGTDYSKYLPSKEFVAAQFGMDPAKITTENQQVIVVNDSNTWPDVSRFIA